MPPGSGGTLAAGVAHEINNPLAYVLGNLDIVYDQVSNMQQGTDVPRAARAQLNEIQTNLAHIRDGARRVAAIGADLRRLAHGGSGERVPVDVERALDAAIGIAAAELRERAQITREYGAVPLVVGDERELCPRR